MRSSCFFVRPRRRHPTSSSCCRSGGQRPRAAAAPEAGRQAGRQASSTIYQGPPSPRPALHPITSTAARPRASGRIPGGGPGLSVPRRGARRLHAGSSPGAGPGWTLSFSPLFFLSLPCSLNYCPSGQTPGPLPLFVKCLCLPPWTTQHQRYEKLASLPAPRRKPAFVASPVSDTQLEACCSELE